jgi:hypothetical protein
MDGMSESGDKGDELGMRKWTEEEGGNDGCGEWGGGGGVGEKMGDE